jgi:MFS family permease
MVPSFNGIIYDIVGPKHLMKANGYTLAAFHIAWVIGSILAGNFINSVGIELAYFLASVSLLTSILPIYLIRMSKPMHRSQEPVWSGILVGFKYVGTNTPLKALLILSVLTETFGFSYIMMLPLIAKVYLNVGATGLGYLSAAGGIGSLIGTVIVVSMSETKNKWTILTITTLIAGSALIIFGNSSWYILSLIIIGIVGLSLAIYDAAIHTLIQLLSIDKMRGRMLGLYGMTWGFNQTGGLLLGVIASIISAPFAIGLGGVVIFIYTGAVISRFGKK